jgi:hypothetical protein
MSGIINRVGSKSGLIGTTEISYESSSYTPDCIEDSASNNKGVYTKIGDFVFATVDMDSASSSSGSTQGINDLPFVPYSESGVSAGGGVNTISGKACGTMTLQIPPTANYAYYRSGHNSEPQNSGRSGSDMSNVGFEGFLCYISK